MKVKPFQKILSYLFPVKIWKGSSTYNPVLELFLYQGHWQLTTDDAIYSDGIRYRPLALAFRRIRKELPRVSKVLVLGSGIGSAVRILSHLGFQPRFVLVDNDEEILGLAGSLLTTAEPGRIELVCAEAQRFVQEDKGLYDLVVVDIFTGRNVPEFVSTPEFVSACLLRMNPGAMIVINYMLNSEEDSLRMASLQQQLPRSRVIDIGINKVLLATV